MPPREMINYVELPAKNIPATKAFFERAFAWSFIDYGEEYTAFSNSGIEGGFFLSKLVSRTANGAC
jgi:predicted enzyme related to lactoylglutathione lyase